jgi:uncharacterized protein (DUF1778 family)
MARKSSRKTRIVAHVRPELLALIERAAEIEGRSVNDFVLTAAKDAADRTIAATENIQFSSAGQRAFAEAVLDTPPPTAGLQEAFASWRRLVRDAR